MCVYKLTLWEKNNRGGEKSFAKILDKSKNSGDGIWGQESFNWAHSNIYRKLKVKGMTSWMKILTKLHSPKGTLQISPGWQAQRPGVKGRKTAVLKKIQCNSFFFSSNCLRIYTVEVYMQSPMGFLLSRGTEEENRCGVAGEMTGIVSWQLKANFEHKFKGGSGFVRVSPSYVL